MPGTTITVKWPTGNIVVNDKDPRATRLVDFYHGYKYIYCFENHKHDKISLLTVVTLWCLEENLSGKCRLDVHRAIKYPSTGNE